MARHAGRKSMTSGKTASFPTQAEFSSPMPPVSTYGRDGRPASVYSSLPCSRAPRSYQLLFADNLAQNKEFPPLLKYQKAVDASKKKMSDAETHSPASPGDTRSPQNSRPRRARACKLCHSLKVRCQPVDLLDPSSPCVRCTNSKKTCEIDIEQPRKRRRPAGKSADVAALHDQIRDLKEQLARATSAASVNIASENHQYGGTASPGQNAIPNQPPLSVLSPEFVSKMDLQKELSILADDTVALGKLALGIKMQANRRKELLAADQKAVDVVSLGLIDMDEARERLNVYRLRLYLVAPLVDIGHTVTPELLIQDQPYLFNVIMSVASMVYQKSKDPDMATKLEAHAADAVVKQVLVYGAKSVELVKSLILLSLWYNSPEFFKLRRYHILSSVAVALVHDLGIVSKKTFSYSFNCHDPNNIMSLDSPSLEYRALVMVLYFSTVSICMILRRAIYTRWTPFVDECCRLLEQSSLEEHKAIAVLLRLNREFERIHHMVHLADSSRLPQVSKFAVAEILANLTMIRHNIAPTDHRALSYFYSVEAYLYQPDLSEVRHEQGNLPDNPTRTSKNLSNQTLRLIANCTTSCLSSLDEFNKLSPEEIASLPLFYGSRIVYTAGMLLRLRFLILLLPSLIEKELVPRFALYTISKLNKNITVALNVYTDNNYLKRTHLVLQLFIQTYVAQVHEIVGQEDGTPANFRVPELPPDRNPFDHITESLVSFKADPIFRAAQDKSYPALHLDLLSYAAAAHRNRGDSESGPSSEPNHKRIPESDRPQLQPNISIDNIHRGQHDIKPLQFHPATVQESSPMTANGNDGGVNGIEKTPMFQNQIADSTAIRPSSSESFFNLDEEFWLNLLTTDRNKLHFAQNDPVMPVESMFFLY